MFVCAVAIALFTFLLGRRYGGPSVAWVATALLSTNIVFVSRTLEIRPDVPAVALWIASQYALFAALSPTGDQRGRRLLFATSGLLLGGTLVFTQKALLAGPGFAVFALVYVAQPSALSRSAALRRSRCVGRQRCRSLGRGRRPFLVERRAAFVNHWRLDQQSRVDSGNSSQDHAAMDGVAGSVFLRARGRGISRRGGCLHC